ncbi:hypothetical protein VE25_17795 [Devosia geojensis]|uniref:Alpha 1,4-glycosyltransferase domain-containing protein n=1 Tax=Devosia geojensis TaxID=443610 RepID=A0A0F5FNQ5_9HYPH|nr:hypothetical protein [Devosia geojensis]KKB10476.1 hypothetical protein VE25_17795 [Devosia geojensis]
MTDTPAPALPVINMFWTGERLHPFARLSMVSYLAAGHRVHLHCYETVKDVPEGIALVDAAETVEEAYATSLLGGRRGAPAMLADYFRLQLQAGGKGIWSDADMVCVKPVRLDAGQPLFGRQDAKTLNNALLYLPAESPIIADILAGFAPNVIPSWLNFNRKRQLWMKRLIGQRFGPTDHYWGTFGPQALTALARKHGVFHQAAPVEVFYPYDHTRAREVFEPDTDIAQFVTDETLCFHLWNEKLRDIRNERPASTSAIGRLLARYGL